MNQKTKILLKENNQFEQKNLSKESQNIMTDIVCYLRGSELTEYNQEIVRRDINDMIAEGERRGETAESVIGRDYQGFCEDIIKSFPKRTVAEKVLTAINQSTPAMSIILFIWLISKIVEVVIRKESIYNLHMTLGELLGNGILVVEAVIILKFITRMIFTNRIDSTRKLGIKKSLFLWLFLTAFIAVPVLLQTLIKSPSFLIVLPLAIILVLLPLLIGLVLDRVEKC